MVLKNNARPPSSTLLCNMPWCFPALGGGMVVGPARDLYVKPLTAAPLRRLHLEISKTDVNFFFNKMWGKFLRNIYFCNSQINLTF